MDILKEKRTAIVIILALVLCFTAMSFYALFVIKAILAPVSIVLFVLLSILLFFKLLNPDSLEITPEGIKWVCPSDNTFIARDNISKISIVIQTSTHEDGTFEHRRQHTSILRQVGILLNDIDAYLKTTEIKKRSRISDVAVWIIKTFSNAKFPDPRTSLLETRQKCGYDILLPNTFEENKLMETLQKYYPDKVVR